MNVKQGIGYRGSNETKSYWYPDSLYMVINKRHKHTTISVLRQHRCPLQSKRGLSSFAWTTKIDDNAPLGGLHRGRNSKKIQLVCCIGSRLRVVERNQQRTTVDRGIVRVFIRTRAPLNCLLCGNKDNRELEKKEKSKRGHYEIQCLLIFGW